MKVVRYVTRLTRKRERQLRPLTVGTFVQKRFAAIPAHFFRWGPAKRFARRYIVPRVLPQMMTGDMPTQEMQAVPKILQRMANSPRHIIVGPWLSEVGFELLYWIPFLNWVKTYRPFDPERMVVVSRGGAGIWYKNITPNYVDLFDFYTPEQFRTKNADRLRENKQKHLALTDFDREILKVAYQHLGNKQVELLHPMYMYRLFYPYWKSQMSISLVETFASFERLPALDTSDVAGELPRDYTAVRFYFNESFPDTEENKLFVMRLLQTLTEAGDVVLLNPGPAHRRPLGDGHRQESAHPQRRSPDDAAEQPGDPDEGDQPGARVRRHVWRAVVPGADVRRDVAGVLLAPREVLAAAPRAGAPRLRRLQARLLRGARHERHRRARPRVRRARPADAGARTNGGHSRRMSTCGRSSGGGLA